MSKPRTDVFEMVMVTIYVFLTAFLFACNTPPRIAFAIRDVVAPFQVKARARNTGAERNAAAWRPSQFESRTRPLSC